MYNVLYGVASIVLSRRVCDTRVSSNKGRDLTLNTKKAPYSLALVVFVLFHFMLQFVPGSVPVLLSRVGFTTSVAGRSTTL